MRKKGAGSMLVEWGVKQAQNDHASSEEGLALYEKRGFKQIDEIHLDFSAHGIAEKVRITMLAANTGEKKGEA